MSIAASWDGLSSSEDEDSTGLPPSGIVAAVESDLDLMAMLARAAVSKRLEVNTPSGPHGWMIGFSVWLKFASCTDTFLPGGA